MSNISATNDAFFDLHDTTPSLNLSLPHVNNDSPNQSQSIWQNIFLSPSALIVSYTSIFFSGLIGNSLVIITLSRNKRFKVRPNSSKFHTSPTRMRKLSRVLVVRIWPAHKASRHLQGASESPRSHGLDLGFILPLILDVGIIFYNIDS